MRMERRGDLCSICTTSIRNKVTYVDTQRWLQGRSNLCAVRRGMLGMVRSQLTRKHHGAVTPSDGYERQAMLGGACDGVGRGCGYGNQGPGSEDRRFVHHLRRVLEYCLLGIAATRRILRRCSSVAL